METHPGLATYFQRYEQKYLLNPVQYYAVLEMLKDYAAIDDYGVNTIYSLYYDTPGFAIARKSRDKSTYKEKLRLRSYGVPQPGDTVYWELKKKLQGVTYKQRIPTEFTPGVLDFHGDAPPQVCNEIRWFFTYYKPLPQCLISYERLAFRSREHTNLRITFDTRIRFRASDLDVSHGPAGTLLLDENRFLMEVKTDRSIPLFLSAYLTRLNLFPVSCSKYRMAFEQLMYKGEPQYA
ncbi:MAG: polyphosphate polymerase domain-containing protein [Treponema sp.]|nr:polyphosphate polymerase domain-containing protein [Treponema sp.]